MVRWGSLCAALAALGLSVFGAQAHEMPWTDPNDAVGGILERADNQGRPFAIVDKRAARLFVFGAKGELIGETPVLLGLARGDESAPDLANRSPSSLLPGERTTPAGRYASEPGHNDKGEDIVWIDYDASLAIHRLRPSPPAERRAERLASTNPDDKRISFGCVVVPVAFYEEVVRPTLGSARGMVYVLPEGGTMRDASMAPRQIVSSAR